MQTLVYVQTFSVKDLDRECQAIVDSDVADDDVLILGFEGGAIIFRLIDRLLDCLVITRPDLVRETLAPVRDATTSHATYAKACSFRLLLFNSQVKV